MIKYENYDVVFREIPDKVSLAINITNCQNNCKYCHSNWLRQDIGKELTVEIIDDFIKKYDGIDCIILMGEGNDKKSLLNIATYIRSKKLLVGLYSGRDIIEDDMYLYFDYIKIGHYDYKLGPINKKESNQRLYNIIIENSKVIKNDITYKLLDKKE